MPRSNPEQHDQFSRTGRAHFPNHSVPNIFLNTWYFLYVMFFEIMVIAFPLEFIQTICYANAYYLTYRITDNLTEIIINLQKNDNFTVTIE